MNNALFPLDPRTTMKVEPASGSKLGLRLPCYRSAATRWRYTQTVAWMVMMLIVFIPALGGAEGLRLLLAPSQTSIKPGATVAFDVYLYNGGPGRREAATLDLLSVVYTIDDISGKRLGRAGGSKEISTGPPVKHPLEPNSIERRTISVEVPAEVGDVVKVYVELGKKPVLRSNTVLLFCPSEASKSE